jgi:hypothetical protein
MDADQALAERVERHRIRLRALAETERWTFKRRCCGSPSVSDVSLRRR